MGLEKRIEERKELAPIQISDEDHLRAISNLSERYKVQFAIVERIYKTKRNELEPQAAHKTYIITLCENYTINQIMKARRNNEKLQ